MQSDFLRRAERQDDSACIDRKTLGHRTFGALMFIINQIERLMSQKQQTSSPM
jgi:hypothetical protein